MNNADLGEFQSAVCALAASGMSKAGISWFKFELQVGKDDQIYIVTASYYEDLKLYIYENGANILGNNADVRFEKYDFDTPAQMAEAIVQKWILAIGGQ